ncbi:phosphomannomutase [Gammaproteobacteria bacterium]|nr:phosphomannomutase [Gammaproteobacteria bacterium]
MKIADLMQSSGVAFGTSGARGTVEAMSNDLCYVYTRAFLQAMQAGNVIQPGSAVVLAGDLRASTPRILTAVARAVEDAGYQMIYAGMVPTPAVTFYAMQQGAASIMVTGSHIPDDRNGIKFNRPDGEILKADENRIREERVNIPYPFPEISENALPDVSPAVAELYLDRYTRFLPEGCLEDACVGIYEHSGVARDLLPKILEQLGAKVTRLGRSDSFIPVDTEAVREEDVRLGQQWSDEYGFDAVVSTDGDADRPLVADEQGKWLRGDIVGVLCARFMGIDKLATPVSSNTLVEACGWFDQVHRTRIGSPYVIEQMNRLLLNNQGRVAGYEANGGFLLASDVTIDGRTMKALPTRDAVLPILSILVSAKQQGCPVSGLVDTLPGRYTASGRLQNFPTDLSAARISALSDSTPDIEQVFGKLCGNVTLLDTTDGLRISFENEEIIHLRPSGNASELRCYNEASSPERAQELNQACLAVLAGWRCTGGARGRGHA